MLSSVFCFQYWLSTLIVGGGVASTVYILKWQTFLQLIVGVSIDKAMKFHAHLKIVCKKAGAKVTALTRLSRVTPMGKKKMLMNSFIKSQFSYCPLIWTFCSRELNDEMNRIHKRGLRVVYLDYTSSFEELLQKDNSVTVHQHNIQLLAIEMFKVVTGIAPKTRRHWRGPANLTIDYLKKT